MHGLVRDLPPDAARATSATCWSGFHYAGAARKVVGVGSVGTRAWIVLMLGRDDGDPLFLQAKEAEASVLEPFLGKSRYANHGQRVVEGQRLMQSASDILLGWIRADRPRRASAATSTSASSGTARDRRSSRPWSRPPWRPTPASAAGRSPGRTPAPATRVAIAGYLGSGETFDRALATFAESYADQNERDYAALQEAVDSGRVQAQVGL